MKILFSFTCILFLFFSFIEPVSVKASETYTIEKYSTDMHLSQEQIADLIAFSNAHHINFELVYHLLYVETGGTFKHNLVGPETKYGKAYGIAQFMENTAPWIAEMYGFQYKNKNDLFNPVYSTKLCICYLHYLNFGGKGHEGYHDWHATLTAYNRGMYGLEAYKKINGTAISVYSQSILKKAF